MTLRHLRLPVLFSVASLAGLGATPVPAQQNEEVFIIWASVVSWENAVAFRDFNGIMAYYAPGDSLFVFDVITPRQYVGAAAYRKEWEETLAPYIGQIHVAVSDWTVDVEGTMAYAHETATISGTGKDFRPRKIVLRITDVFRKIDGNWLVVHEHVSVPIDPVTNKPDFDSKM